MNVRCYQPTDVSFTAFLLPINTTDFSKAVYPDSSGYINGTNLDHLVSLWLNVSMPVPPYWNSSVPGLTITQKWAENPFRPDTIPYYGHTLPSKSSKCAHSDPFSHNAQPACSCSRGFFALIPTFLMVTIRLRWYWHLPLMHLYGAQTGQAGS
jgi:hypothetical protein